MIGGAKSKETRYSTVTVGFDRTLQLNSPTFANKEAKCRRVGYRVLSNRSQFDYNKIQHGKICLSIRGIKQIQQPALLLVPDVNKL